MADTDDADGATSRPGGRRAAAALALVGTTGGTFLTQYSSGAYQSVGSVVVLSLGSLLLGVVAGVAVLGTLGGLRRPLRQRIERVDRRLAATAALAAVLVVVISVLFTTVVAPLGVRAYAEAFGCAPAATEFTVVTSDGQRSATSELVADFERATAGDHNGCPSVHGFVYDVPEGTLSPALAQNWAPDQGDRLNPLRDVGPRPDVWLAESTLPVDRLLAAAPAVVRPDPGSYAVSPLVLAVPGAAPAPAVTTTGLSLPGIVETQAATGVVRPDPTVSTAGALATAGLYGIDVERSTDPVDPPRADDRTIERRLSAAADAEAYPSGTETDTLCHYRSVSGPRASLLISEQSVLRFDEGRPLDPACASPAIRPAPGASLRAYYPRAPVLDHRFVRFSWTPPGSRRDQAVNLFEEWLHSSDGGRALGAVGLRPTPTTGDGHGDVDAGAVDGTVLPRYRLARQARRDLLAVDQSGSMAEPEGSRRRYDGVVDAVTGALAYPRPGDQIGLWVFPGDAGGRTPRVVVPVGGTTDSVGGSTRAAAVTAAVATAVPQGNTPLFRTVVDGVRALAATDSLADRRLVVVTDGEDTTSDLAPSAVLDQVRGLGVEVDIVTLGDVSCDSDPLRALGDLTGGHCYDPGATSADVATALGGG